LLKKKIKSKDVIAHVLVEPFVFCYYLCFSSIYKP